MCTEFASVSPDSDETPYTSVTVWDDEDVVNLSLMCDDAHQHGALAGVELAPWWCAGGPARVALARDRAVTDR